MRYIDISRVKPDEVRIKNKRFWTAQGERITSRAPAAFTPAVNQSATRRAKHAPHPAHTPTPVHTRKLTAHKTVDTATLKTLLDFAKEMGWSVTRTGRELANDPTLIGNIRNGRHIKPDRARRLADRMEELRQCREHNSGKPTPTPN